MAQFDPRRRPLRFAPHVLTAAAAIAVAALTWRVFQPFDVEEPKPPLTAAALSALEAQAFASAETRPGLDRPESVPVKVRRGETLEDAVRRTGVPAEDASAAVQALASAVDTVNVKAGLAFEAAIAKPREGRGGSARLIGLTMRTGPAKSLTLSRSFDGAMKLRELEEKISDETTVADGEIHGSLSASAAALGANSKVVGQTVKLFSHKLDFSRDIKAGDGFTMVFDRKVTESGRTIETGDLLFAEIDAKGGPARFYRFTPSGSSTPQYFDETGKNIRGFLLRTPVDGARMSSGFGMRRHPILGYAKMHQGIDFAAGTGTPILAAGDGVVVEARRWGGYGNWVRIRHSGGWETGYAHMSRFGAGIKAGTRVRQGQLIGYVGTTGRSTGPHLHHEVWFQGKRVNPKGAKVPQGTILGGRDLAAFKVQKSRIDALVAKKRNHVEEGGETLKTAAAETEGLRPAERASRRG
ncbi:M23 family metallopeptidase [Caulobacter sp. 17J65-9]|uniref:M23 family metallopeptidase n=1 Tax=Caulobacter sp. 17J65-9 TaxID=2709382 RepID=UPI0013CB5FCB|nr:M23 family metallopeptidase [Caulobacter sp. 17J65-9]NEX93025.1 M23 family metallopeptidase [Caulobacter sp. 17J65-9]